MTCVRTARSWATSRWQVGADVARTVSVPLQGMWTVSWPGRRQLQALPRSEPANVSLPGRGGHATERRFAEITDACHAYGPCGDHPRCALCGVRSYQASHMTLRAWWRAGRRAADPLGACDSGQRISLSSARVRRASASCDRMSSRRRPTQLRPDPSDDQEAGMEAHIDDAAVAR
jgi:hypothetical protein